MASFGAFQQGVSYMCGRVQTFFMNPTWTGIDRNSTLDTTQSTPQTVGLNIVITSTCQEFLLLLIKQETRNAIQRKSRAATCPIVLQQQWRLGRGAQFNCLQQAWQSNAMPFETPPPLLLLSGSMHRSRDSVVMTTTTTTRSWLRKAASLNLKT